MQRADAGKDRRQEEKGMTKDEMAGWHHRLDGHEFEQALGGMSLEFVVAPVLYEGVIIVLK